MYPDKENDDAYNRMQFSYKTKLRKKTVLRYDVSFKQYTRGRRCVQQSAISKVEKRL